MLAMSPSSLISRHWAETPSHRLRHASGRRGRHVRVVLQRTAGGQDIAREHGTPHGAVHLPTHICRAAKEVSPSKSGETATYTLEQTKILVETSMLAAVSGLTYMVSTILKLEGSLGYFLPLPIILSSMRSGAFAGWRTMYTTGFLLVVLLGPLRAVSYVFIHGLLAATLGTLWKFRTNWWLSVVVGALVRMTGQCAYLLLTSLTMNENLFLLMLSNVYSMLDQISASIGASGAPSTLAVVCMIFSLLLVNGLCYSFLLHVVYRILLNYMGFELGPLPGIVKKYLFAGALDPAEMERQSKS